jgi:hypothetical protein
LNPEPPSWLHVTMRTAPLGFLFTLLASCADISDEERAWVGDYVGLSDFTIRQCAGELVSSTTSETTTRVRVDSAGVYVTNDACPYRLLMRGAGRADVDTSQPCGGFVSETGLRGSFFYTGGSLVRDGNHLGGMWTGKLTAQDTCYTLEDRFSADR